MIIFKKAATLTDYLQVQRKNGKSIGFVPTMGALHPGHVSLVDRSRSENDITVCSIFVNPTQFNNAEDLAHYPVTIEADIEKLITAGCSVLFLPSRAEVYPQGHIKKHYDIGYLETILEGLHRPGHFQGVCEVVDRLLNITIPHRLYLGQKDFQQCMVIKKILVITGWYDLQLRISPTIREADGLAMSSRNMRLSEEQRYLATTISGVLSRIQSGDGNAHDIEWKAIRELEEKGFTVDYLQILDAETLDAPKAGQPQVALVAASLGPIRLIDNMLLN